MTPDDWRDHAACAGHDTSLWFTAHKTATVKTVCGRCPVRAECLHDALTHDTPNGIWGGLTIGERRALPAPPRSRTAAISSLRVLLAERDPADTAAGPAKERTAPPMLTPPAPTTAAPVDARSMPIGSLLRWGDEHPDPDVQAQAARARAALAGLHKQHAADQERAALATEREQLEARLAEVQAREAELTPQRAGKRKPSYPAPAVRTWAKAAGVDCPTTGRIPKTVVDAWRQATGDTTS